MKWDAGVGAARGLPRARKASGELGGLVNEFHADFEYTARGGEIALGACGALIGCGQ